jgi:hypothetical protein
VTAGISIKQGLLGNQKIIHEESHSAIMDIMLLIPDACEHLFAGKVWTRLPHQSAL